MNPFIDRSNPNFEVTGNPYLRPVVNNDLQFGISYNKKVSLNIGLSYSFSKNIDLRVSKFDTATKITRVMYENLGKASRLGVDYNFSYPIKDRLRLNINGNVAQFWIDGIVDNYYAKNDMLTYYLSSSLNYNSKREWQINASVSINSKSPTGLQSYINSLVNSSFSVSKSFLKGKLSASTFINNPFQKFRNNQTHTFGSNFLQNNITREYYRKIGLSINYKFGKKEYELKWNKRQINNNDLSN